MDLSQKKCISPHVGDLKVLVKKDIKELLAEIPGWELSKNAKKITKEFAFKDFSRAMRFVSKVADVAKVERHYPDVHVYCDKAVFDLWTRGIGGLSENDFIMAAKIDKLKAIDIS